MSTTLDAGGIGNQIVRLGLATDDQVRDCLLELEDRSRPAEDLVRLMERKRLLSPLQGSKLLKGDTDGYALGGYRLLYKIASGSFGRVYRGDDPRTGESVAVKVLRNKWAEDKQKVDLFLREGKVGLGMQHPNLVNILAVNRDPQTKQYYLVMEFVEGGTLRDLLTARKKLPPDEGLRILEECASGLAYAFGKGLTHRDIKPTNILISAQGHAKLVDFGLAEVSAGSETHDEKDDDVAVDRTVDYAGLEKATGQKPGDVRSDIYFLGAVLYECVTGEPLMPQTKDRNARMSARRYEDVENTLSRKADVLGIPPPVVKLLGKMVAFDPAQRFQSPTLMVEAIRRCREQLAGNAGAGGGGGVPAGPTTLFIVEQNAKLQNAFREKFKEHGYRVLISLDPAQALKRYQTAPYHALIVDCGTVGQEGVEAYTKVLKEAGGVGLHVGAVLILNEDQTGWASQAGTHPNGAVLVRPVTMKQLLLKVYELAPSAAAEGVGAGEE